MDREIALEEAIKAKNTELVEKILIKKTKQNPENIEYKFRLCMTELEPPFYDYISALKCIEEIYEIEPDNIPACILYAGIEYNNTIISKSTFEKLECIRTSDRKTMAIIYYLEALYYRGRERIDIKKKLLKKSIQMYNSYPYVLQYLAWIYIDEFRYIEARDLLKRALNSVKHIYGITYEKSDFTDYQEYIDELITGVSITDTCYSFIVKDLQKTEENINVI